MRKHGYDKLDLERGTYYVLRLHRKFTVVPHFTKNGKAIQGSDQKSKADSSRECVWREPVSKLTVRPTSVNLSALN